MLIIIIIVTVDFANRIMDGFRCCFMVPLDSLQGLSLESDRLPVLLVHNDSLCMVARSVMTVFGI